MDTTYFIEDYTNYMHSNIAFVPKSYHRSTALFLVSSMLNSNVKIKLVRGTVYPNLWIMLLGPPSSTKKTTAISRGLHTVSQVPIEKFNMAKFTVEGAVECMNTMAKDGEVSTYAAQDEFGQLLAMFSNPHTAELKDFLCKIFDVDLHGYKLTYKNQRKAKPLKCVYMPLLVATTPTRLKETITQKEVESGIPTRFLYDYTTVPSRYLPDRISDGESSALETHLQEELLTIYFHYASNPHILLSDTALGLWNTWNEEFHAKMMGQSSMIATFTSRLATTVLKFCMIFAAERLMHEITPELFDMAVREVDYYIKKATEVTDMIEYNSLANSPENRKVNYVLDKITRAKTITHSTLVRSARNVTVKEVRLIVADLAERGDILIQNSGYGKGGLIYTIRRTPPQDVPKLTIADYL